MKTCPVIDTVMPMVMPQHIYAAAQPSRSSQVAGIASLTLSLLKAVESRAATVPSPLVDTLNTWRLSSSRCLFFVFILSPSFCLNFSVVVVKILINNQEEPNYDYRI